MKLRVLAFTLAILAFFLFVCSPLEHNVNAIVGVDDALITILIAALAAIGITFVTTGAFSNTHDYVSNLLEQYADSQGVTVGSLFNGVDTGVNKQGKLLLNNRFVILLNAFATWLKAELGLSNNVVYELQAGGSFIGDMICYTIPISATIIYPSGYVRRRENIISGGAQVYALLCYENTNNVSRYGYVLVCDRSTYAIFDWADYINTAGTILDLQGQQGFALTLEDKSIRGINITNSNLYTAIIVSGDTNNMATPFIGNFSININNPVYYTADEISSALSNTLSDIVTKDSVAINAGTIVPPFDDNDYEEGDGVILDVGGYWGEGYGDITDDTIPSAFEDSSIAVTSITYESEGTVEDQVEESQSEAQSVSQQVSDYQVNGLVSVFPFCIPFDLYNFVACLAADPVAPSFTWRFYVPGICDEEIEIDLSEFDAAAQILRTMELLLFCVGLAFVTRKIIRG